MAIELHYEWKLIERNCRNVSLGFENLRDFELMTIGCINHVTNDILACKIDHWYVWKYNCMNELQN